MANQKYSGDLRLNTTEKFGPKANSRDVGILHPDMHQNSFDRGKLHQSYRPAHCSTWLQLAGSNVNLINLTDEEGNVRPSTDTQGNIDKAKRVKFELADDSAEAIYVNERYAHENTGTCGIQQDPDKVLYKE